MKMVKEAERNLGFNQKLEKTERNFGSKNGVVVGGELTIKPITTGISKEAYSNYLLKKSQANYDSAVGFADKAYAGWTDAQTMASAVTAWDRLAADIEKLSTFDDTYAEDAQNFRKVAEQMKELQAIYGNYNSNDELKTSIEQAQAQEQAQEKMLIEINNFDMNAARRELDGLKRIARESENYTHVKSTHKNPRNYWIGQQTYEFFGDGREIETYEDLLKAIDAREQKLQDMKPQKEALEGYERAATIDGVTEDFAAKLPNNEYMTEAERETYNKLSRLVNSNAAKEFWNAIEEGVNIRKGVADYERLKDTKVGKYFYWAKAGLDSFAQGIKNHFSPYDTYYAPTSTSVTSSLLRQDMGEVGGAIYDIGLNVTRVAPSILISRILPVLGASKTVAAIGGLLPMGTSVHGEAYAQMINEGYTHGQASLYADLMALSETSLTYLLSGMGNLGMQALPNSAMNKILQGVDNGLFAFAITNAGEGFEEGLQLLIEMVVKGAITGDYENLDVGEVLYATLMGWATSAVMEGTSSAISKGVSKFTKPTPTVNGMIHTAMTEQLLNLAKDAPQYSTSRIMAEKLTDNSWQGAYDIAKYLGYRGKGLTADSAQKLTRSLIERGIDSSSARTIAENVSNVSNGKTLSEKKQDALNKNGVVTSAMVDYVIQEDMVNNEKLTKGYEAIEQSIKNNAKRMTQPVTVQNGTQATEVAQKPTETPKTEQTPAQNTEPVKIPSKTVDESAFNQGTKSQLNKLSKALGMNIRVFSQDAVGGYIRNGYIDESTNTIYLNDKSKNPVAVVLKHELTHSTENVPDYALFSESVFTSQAFKKWLNGKSFADYRTEYIKDRQEAKDENFAESIDADELANRADQEILADFVSEALFTKNGLTDLINTLEGKSRTGFIEWVLNCIRSVINKIKGIDTTLENELRALEKEYASLLNKSTKNKKSTGEGVKYSLKIKHSNGTIEILNDARKLTNEQAIKYLYQAQSGKLKWNSYIPVRKDTPQVIIDTLKAVGEEVDNLSLVMQVRKAQQAMSNNNKGSKTVKHGSNTRGHALSAKEIVEIINNLDNPNTIILQTNRYNTKGDALPNNVAVFVEYNNNGNESVAVIEFESSISPEFIGTEFGDTNYHTVVTVFEPDIERNGVPFDYAEELLSNPDNFELNIEKRQNAESAIGKKHPNTSSKLPSSKNSVTEIKNNVNKKSSYSKVDAEGNTLSEEQQEYFKDSAVRDTEGRLIPVYHGTEKGGFTVFDPKYSDDKISLFFSDDIDLANSYSGSTKQIKLPPNRKEGLARRLEPTHKGNKKGIYKVYLNLTNPYILDGKGRHWDELYDFYNEFNTVTRDVKFAYDKNTYKLTAKATVDGKTVTKTFDLSEAKNDTQKTAFAEALAVREYAQPLIESFYKDLGIGKAAKVGNERVKMLITDIIAHPDRYKENTAENVYDHTVTVNADTGEVMGKITTRMVGEWAKANGYDGVIFKDIIDVGGQGSNRAYEPRNVYITFNSEQVKSVDNKAPTSDSDIRYSISPEQSEQLDQLLYDGEITPEEARKIRASKNPIAEIKKIIDLSEKDVDTDVKGAKQKRAKLRKFFEDLKKTAKMAEKEIKDSKFFDSIQNAEWLDDDFKEETYKEEYLKHYVGITNQETLDEAATKLNSEGRKAVLEWQSKKASHANAVDVAMGFILLERAKQKGDIDAQVFIADKLREIGTTSGQTVQAFSILGRMTPEGMLKYAQHELSKALEIMQEYQTQRWIDKYSERFALTPEEAELITRKTRAAAKLPTDSRQQQILLAEIAAIIQDKIPSKAGTGIKAVQRVAMLLNSKTHIRNIMGNVGATPLFQFGDLFGGIADAVVTKAVQKKGFNAQRTTAPINISLKTDMQSLARGFAEAFDDYKRGISTRNMTESRYGVTGGKALNENTKSAAYNAVARAFNKVDAFNSFLLEMGDRPFYEMWFTRSLNAQMKLNKVSEPTQAMIDIAVQEALARTWQDNNAWTKSVSAIKEGLNSIPLINPSSINKSWADYGLGDMLIKFTKTPANLTKALVDFSPLGAANIIRDLSKFTNELGKGKYDPKLQKALVDSIGKMLAGTLTYVMLTSLMHMGAIVLTGANDEDKDVRAFENYIMGMPEYSIKVGDTYITYDWAQPVGGIMAIVADYMKAKDEGKSTVENLLEGVKGGSDIILRQSFMKALQEFFGTEGSFADKLMSAAFSEPSVYVPQILSQFAELTDDSRRVTYTGNAFETAWNKVKNKIPGLRQTLEKDVNVMGETAENPRNDIWNAFFSPGNVYSKSESEAISEIYRVYKATGEKSVIPPKADSYITVKGVKHTFTAEEKTQIQREMGTIAAQIIDDVMDDKRYDDLSDQQKVTLFGNIYKYAKAKAKASISYDYEMLHAMYGDSLTKAKYDSFSKKQRKMLAEEYYLDSYSKLKNGEEADYFLGKMNSSNEKTSNSSEKTIANVEKNK